MSLVIAFDWGEVSRMLDVGSRESESEANLRDRSRLVAVDHPDVAAFLAMAPHSATTVRTSGARDAQLGDHGALSTAICSAYTARHALMMILTHGP